jgi:hypothetical protein
VHWRWSLPRCTHHAIVDNLLCKVKGSSLSNLVCWRLPRRSKKAKMATLLSYPTVIGLQLQQTVLSAESDRKEGSTFLGVVKEQWDTKMPLVKVRCWQAHGPGT